VEAAWCWCARILFGGSALLVWLAWAYVIATPGPLGVHALAIQLAPHPDRHVDALRLACALAGTGAATWLMFLCRPRQAALQTWVVGITLCWGLLATLFLPWVDEVKSFRQVFHSLQRALGPGTPCLASYGLGESERAMLHYYDGIVTERLEVQPSSRCTLILLENPVHVLPRCSDAATWQPLWEGARPAERHEHFWLFRRAPGAATCTGAG
jgi:hypothetical protein